VTYVQEVRERLKVALPELREERNRVLLDLYALLVLVRGEWTTPKQVHDAWSFHASRTRPDHPAIVPFGELSSEVQDLDVSYAVAIRNVAKAIGKVG
jgi:hypothetical protein